MTATIRTPIGSNDMKHLYKYLLSILFLPLVLLSCTSDRIKDNLTNKPGIVRFTLATSGLRASGTEKSNRPTPALEREKSISKLYAVVYRKSSGIHYKTIQCTSVGTGTNSYEFDNEKSGDFYFFLIANPDDALETALKAGPTTPDDLGLLVASQTPGEDSQATNFLMTSKQVDVTVQPKTTTTISEKIKLERVAARFDFYNKIDGLEISKITFGLRYTSTHLFAQVNKRDDLTTTSDKVYTGSPLFVSNALTATIYGYETDKRSETFFTIEATYKGHPIKPQTIRLENFAIKRNYLYNIILHDLGGAVKPNDPQQPFGQLKYQVQVADWSDDGVTIGVEEDKVSKSLIVDYEAELAYAPYMTPYLKDSQKEIYTITNKATAVTLKVNTFIRQGSLELKEGYNKGGVSLTEEGSSIKDYATGRITRVYKLTLPKRDQFVAINHFQADDKLGPIEFFDVPLVAKNFSGETTKEFIVRHGRIKMPLEYLSKAPLNKAGDGFTSEPNKFSSVGYFTHDTEAVPKFGECEIQGKKYHMPRDYYELCSLIPRGATGGTPVVGQNGISADNQWEYIVMPSWIKAGVNKKNYIAVLASDFRTNKAKSTSYGLRFKHESKLGFGNKLLIAYKYEWHGDFARVKSNGPGVVNSYVKITCRYLGENFNGRVEDIMNEDFWAHNNEGDVSRTIYAMGSYDKRYDTGPYDESDDPRDRDLGVEAYMICLKVDKSDPGYVMASVINRASWMSNHTLSINDSYPIWLFSNE